jgi:predicted ATPase/DNA-binding CsgD family transcriptional regulator
LASPAVQLFVERARAVRGDFVLERDNTEDVVQICSRLDGLPLALELAAARMAHLSAGELDTWLERRLPVLTSGARDLPDRQRTMRDAIAWSYDLLTPDEQALFRRLAVFRGGCTVEEAEIIVNAEQAGELDVFNGIASLVNKHLLRQVTRRGGPSRYEMFEVVREFALERLAESSETEVQRRHAAWCVQTAEQSWDAIWVGPLQLPVLDALSDEHDNMRGALTWLAAQHDVVSLLRLIAGLCPFWYYRSHRTEGRRWIEKGLAAAATAEVPLLVRAQFLHGAATLFEGESASQSYLEEDLALWRELEQPLFVGASLVMLALLANNQGDYARAARLADEALPIFAAGNPTWLAAAQIERGRAEQGAGDFRQASHWFESSLLLGRESGDSYSIGLGLNSLALVALLSGESHAAAPRLAEALHVWRGIVRLEGLAHCLAEVAMLAAVSGQPAAARLWGAVAAAQQIAGHEFGLPESAVFTQAEANLRSQLGATRFEQEYAAGELLGLEEALAEAVAVVENAGKPSPRVAEEPSRFGLTPREMDVLRLVVAGQTDREIAETLFISRRTAEWHVAAILGKLGVRSRAAAVAAAVRAGIAPDA